MRERVLVVDDEVGGREAFKMILKDDYEVITSEDGVEALEIIKEKRPKVVILDILMPGLSGIEVLKKIKEFDEGIEVIMVTATKNLSTAIEAIELGAFDYLVKPFDMREVRMITKRAMEHKALVDELKSLREEIQRLKRGE
jgi:DNA-binding NtrC family response regulator